MKRKKKAEDTETRRKARREGDGRKDRMTSDVEKGKER